MEGISNGNIWGRSIPGRGNSQSGDPEAGVCGQHGSSRVDAAERGRAERVRVWVRGCRPGLTGHCEDCGFSSEWSGKPEDTWCREALCPD